MDAKQYSPVILKPALQITALYSLHYFTYSKQFRFEGEAHDFWELIYCDSGEARIVDKETELILPEGTAFLHAPRHFHNVYPNNRFTNVVIVSFDGVFEGLTGGLLNFAGQPLPLGKNEKALLKTILSEARAAFAEPLNLVYQYELKLKDKAPEGALNIIKNCLEILLVSLYRKQAEAQPAQEGGARSYAEILAAKITEILVRDVCGNIRLGDIAAELNYSQTYIKKVFREATGTSIIQTYISLKIEKAKQLLSETAYTVSEISEILGFDSVQYFSRLFKKITNMTPTAYQNSVSSGIL